MKPRIETIIKRDNSLIDVKAWHLGYTRGLKKWLGWSYSDTVFYIHDGYTEIMRPPHEHAVEFKEYLLNKIDTDAEWLTRETKNFEAFLLEIYDFYKTSTEHIKAAVTNDELASIYKKYVDLIECAMGPFITMFWIPNWLESDPERAVKYKNEIKLALEYRKKSEKLFPEGALLTDLILLKVSNMTGYDQKLCRTISGDELVAFLREGKVIDKVELEKRLVGFVYSKDGIFLTDNTLQSLVNVFDKLGYEYIVRNETGSQELKGQIACKGYAKGKARVIMSKKDIALLETGEILVTSMTTPEYLPAMERSAAFVTDEGGVTCHAAIVARELGKPCLIGTKSATSTFKTGEMLEVDAEKGTVRRIN